MQKIKIGHCGGYIMPRAKLVSLLKGNTKASKLVKASKAKEFIGLQGDTKVNGYLMVIQTLTNKYPNLEVIAVDKNMSIYAI